MYSGQKFYNFLIKNCSLLNIYPSIKDVQATEEAFSSQNMKFLHFLFFVGHFCPPGSGSSRPKSQRIWIRNSERDRIALALRPAAIYLAVLSNTCGCQRQQV
jgi:hypothetical protein